LGARAPRLWPRSLWASLRRLGRLCASIASIPPRPDLGRRGEALAERYLRRRGFKILARNFRTRSGEVDLVALAGDTLVFVEVKSRGESERGDPLDRIDDRKARRIRRAGSSFRRRFPEGYQRCRMDAVVVEFRKGWGGWRPAASVRWYPALRPFDDLDG
jgi:putative endonuclease